MSSIHSTLDSAYVFLAKSNLVIASYMLSLIPHIIIASYVLSMSSRRHLGYVDANFLCGFPPRAGRFSSYRQMLGPSKSGPVGFSDSASSVAGGCYRW
jgi:hypothetical protein